MQIKSLFENGTGAHFGFFYCTNLPVVFYQLPTYIFVDSGAHIRIMEEYNQFHDF